MFKTTDLMFVRQLRERLEKEDLIPSEQFLAFLYRERVRIANIHIRLHQDSAGGLASAMYQDGLLHALEDVLTSTALGAKRRETFEADLAQAKQNVEKMEKRKDPIEVAYWSGRTEIMKRFQSRNRASIPPYFHPYRLSPHRKFIKGQAL